MFNRYSYLLIAMCIMLIPVGFIVRDTAIQYNLHKMNNDLKILEPLNTKAKIEPDVLDNYVIGDITISPIDNNILFTKNLKPIPFTNTNIVDIKQVNYMLLPDYTKLKAPMLCITLKHKTLGEKYIYTRLYVRTDNSKLEEGLE